MPTAPTTSANRVRNRVLGSLAPPVEFLIISAPSGGWPDGRRVVGRPDVTVWNGRGTTDPPDSSGAGRDGVNRPEWMHSLASEIVEGQQVPETFRRPSAPEQIRA
ncbi:hypothetical protein Pen02_21400 [Plantactinospora endophytica]|uniref:Uncharacterized protein n=1 Tax=Plantactinospora endophytica TaxID=673535 RepID=A0ABQ4DXL6_9ACTN|nr:hypothetical protein Pen02_21400 [Plantactinospora endophytica]